jgi:hypothetical protein
MDVDAISQLDDSAFRELITTNIHPADNTDEAWKQLTAPQVVERTHDTLQAMRKQVEAALGKRRRDIEDFRTECHLRGPAGKQDYFAAKTEYQDWKRRANSFRYMVEARQAQARSALRAAVATARQENLQEARPLSRKRVAYHDALRDLALAVQRHQAAFAVSGRIAEQQDYDLWRRLGEIRVPVRDDDEASLRDMLITFWVETEADTAKERRDNERLMRQVPAGRSSTFEGTPRARHLGNGKSLAEG